MTQIDVHIERAEGTSWPCPHNHKDLLRYDNAPERTWWHPDTYQFQTLLIARIPEVEYPEHGIVLVTFPWAEPHGRSTLLHASPRFSTLLHASHGAIPRRRAQTCQTVKGACGQIGTS